MAIITRHDVKDLSLAPEGVRRIAWADRHMPVLAAIRDRFVAEQPLAGYRIAACLHVTSETANLMRTLKAGGADIVLCASNPLSTQDDVAAALVEEFDVSVFAIKGEDNDTYYRHIEAAVDHKPQLTMDDGADVIGVLQGVALRARGMGAHVIVTEVDPLRALEATMDGFEVGTMNKAAETGDIFCTATGDKSVITRKHLERMKDGAILANTGHFNVEIEIPALRQLATETRKAREVVEEFELEDGKRLFLIAEGRLVNLSSAEGHPAAVMDMSFANQALSAEYVVTNAGSLERHVYPVPSEIDNEIARLKLATMGIEIDTLSEEQAKYLASWDEGT